RVPDRFRRAAARSSIGIRPSRNSNPASRADSIVETSGIVDDSASLLMLSLLRFRRVDSAAETSAIEADSGNHRMYSRRRHLPAGSTGAISEIAADLRDSETRNRFVSARRLSAIVRNRVVAPASLVVAADSVAHEAASTVRAAVA